MPTIFIIFGLIFMFFANDHEPVHIHAVKGDAEFSIARSKNDIQSWTKGFGIEKSKELDNRKHRYNY